MLMSFDWSAIVGDFFFKGLAINDVYSLTILCVVFVVLSIVYEAMKVHSAQVRARTARERKRAASCAPSETAILLSSNQGGLTFSKRFRQLGGEALLFFMHTTLGYAIMLAVMMYNGYLFVSVVLATGLGYFIFGHISMKMNMENIQARNTNAMCSSQSYQQNESLGQAGSTSGQATTLRQQNEQQSSAALQRIQDMSDSNIVADSCRL